MSDLPPLPEGDDPWELLEVPRSADERELKRAYARRIKVYRPDRAPEAFARIHAAYEGLQRYAKYRARAAAYEEDAQAAEEVADPPAAVDPAPAGPVVAEPAVDPVSPPAASPVRPARIAPARASIDELAAGPVTWRMVAAWDEPERAARVWLAALRLRLRDPARHAEVAAMLEEPALLADVDHDETAAMVALSAVSAVAWHGAAGDRLFRHLGKIPHHPVLERLRDRALLDLALTRRFRALPATNPLHLPAALKTFLWESPLVGPAEHAAMREALYDDLERDLDEWVRWVRVLYRVHYIFADALTERLLESVPPHRRVLGALPTPLRHRLGARLRAVKAPVILFLPYFVVSTAAVVAAFVLGGDPAGEPAFFAACLGSFGAYAFERERYRQRIRTQLLRVILDVGVTRAAVHEWLGTFATRALRLAPYRMFMPGDDQLRLLSFLAAATHPDDRPRAGADRDAGDPDDDDDEHEDDGGDDEDGSLIRPDDADAPRGPIRRFFDWFNDLPFVR